MEPDSLSFLTLINEVQSDSDGVVGVFVFKTSPFRLIIGSWSCITMASALTGKQVERK